MDDGVNNSISNNTPLSTRDQIFVRSCAANSYEHNPRNLEFAHRSATTLRTRLLGELVSPNNWCSVHPEYNLWPWARDDDDDLDDDLAAFNAAVLELVGTDEVVDLAAALEIGESDDEDSEQGDTSFSSTTSTLDLGPTEYRACDFALFYSHLSGVLPLDTSPTITWSEIPLALIELKKNVSRRLEDGSTTKNLAIATLMNKARWQLGEQAGFMFGNRRLRSKPLVYGIAMVADAWSHAIFYRHARPQNFDTNVSWKLPREEWSPILVWGSPESDARWDEIATEMRSFLATHCGVNPVL